MRGDGEVGRGYRRFRDGAYRLLASVEYLERKPTQQFAALVRHPESTTGPDRGASLTGGWTSWTATCQAFSGRPG